MREQEVRNLWEAYLEVCEQETGRGPRISDTYDMRDAEGGPKGGGTIKIKGPKKKNVIRKEEVEAWVNQLVKEGYDLSEYSWDDMSEIYISEVKGIEGHINPNTGKSFYGLDSGLAMTPRKRMETRANALQTRGEGKRANKIRAVMNRPSMEESFDLYDIILSHLIEEGYAESVEQAEAIMVNMSEDWRESICEGGFNNSGRYDVGGGRTVGPVAGAVRSLFGGNLPKGQTYVPPSPQNGTNRPPAVPSSKGDSGKLTDFGAGGGKAKLKTGMSVGQVERQGRMNKGDYSG